MSVQFDWWKDGDGFQVTFTGLIDIHEITDTIDYWRADQRAKSVKKQIWDFSNADLSNIYESDTQIFRSHIEFSSINVALISNDEHARDLFMAYAKRSKQTGSDWEIVVLKSIDQAHKWLEGQISDIENISEKMSQELWQENVDLTAQNEKTAPSLT